MRQRAPASQPASGRPGLVWVDRYLLPREVALATVRKHPAALAAPAALALGALAAAVLLSQIIPAHQHHVLVAVWLLWAVLALWFVWKVLNWSVDYFVVTDNRMLLTSGFFNRNVAAVPMTKVTDLTFQRSFAGRLFGFGELIVETAAQDQALNHVDYIPAPEKLYRMVCQEILFPGHRYDEADE
jgi:membrane protein YdbS with pleckstrin-like domain